MSLTLSALMQGVRDNLSRGLTRGAFKPVSSGVPRQAYYFQLHLTPIEEAERGGWRDGVKLAAGVRYTVQAVVSVNQDGRSTQLAVAPERDMELTLTCDHGLVEITPPVQTVPQQVANGTSFTFVMQVATDYQGDLVRLRLQYRWSGALTEPIEIARREVAGQRVQAERRLPRRQIVLDGRLREPVRMVHVERVDAEHVEVCMYWDERTDFAGTIRQPGVSLARWQRLQDRPWELIHRIIARSSDNVEFADWVKGKLVKYGAAFSLIIYDETDEADVAWELIHVQRKADECPLLPGDLTGVVPIGALMTITRWVPGLHWFGEVQELTVAETSTRGRVMAYLNHKEGLPAAQRERVALQPFVVEHSAELAHFKRQLTSGLAETGLIYMGCHGIVIHEEAEKNFLLGLNPRFEVYDLVGLPYLADRAARPIVMVNACHSAWLFRQEGMRYGLAVALLKQVAKDFIGTIGVVGDSRAAEVAEAIFAAVEGSAEGVRLAAVLSDLRAEVFRRTLVEPRSEELGFDYLDTFMYVYYGNPYGRLQLTRAAGNEETGTER